MDSLRIDNGEVRLAINDDPNNLLIFNPKDLLFVEKFYALQAKLEKDVVTYKAEAEKLEAVTELDSKGLPVNAKDRLRFLRETGEKFRAEIDILFGEGTSKRVFGDAIVLDAFLQFFQQLAPYIKKSRTEKVEQYTTLASAKKNKRKR